MSQFLSPMRILETDEDAYDVCEAPRPVTSYHVQDHNRISFIPSSRCTSPSSTSNFSRPCSVSSYSSYGYDFQVPRLTQTPWERERYQKKSVWRRTRTEYVFPAHVFKRLPREVYDCIVEKLVELHFEQEQACPCYLQDLFNLSLTSRAWDRAATRQMYQKVWLLTNEDTPKMPKLKIKGTSRLKLLRRTLRERPLLGRCVRELHLSDFLSLYQNASIDREDIVNLVASLVMACPNLERLVGFHTPYTHSFDRLSHALSTRRNLKERVWLLTENPDPDVDEDEEEESGTNYYNAACDPTERFLELNANHPNLNTLVLNQEQDQRYVPLNFRAIIGTFRQLPSLRHLSISALPSSSFTNMTLNALPPNLKSLRLENLPGINDKGLQRFANSSLSTSLESVTLIDLEISSLTTISNFISPHLDYLKRFVLSQNKIPTLPFVDELLLLQSSTLEYIHWEIRSQAVPLATSTPSNPSFPFPTSEPISCLATSLLSTCIQKGLFPSLRKIRAPHDPQGLLQALCKPLATALLPSDAGYRSPRSPKWVIPGQELPVAIDGLSSMMYPDFLGDLSTFASSPGTPPLPCPTPGSKVDSPMSAVFNIHPSPAIKTSSYNALVADNTATMLSPAASRSAAQSRILAARRAPFITVRITDPQGTVRVDKPTGGFLGKLDSKITYEVRPDRTRVVDEQEREGSQWIIGVADVARLWEVVEGEGYREVCETGHWVRGGIGSVAVAEMF